jgi:hypothetical protein
VSKDNDMENDTNWTKPQTIYFLLKFQKTLIWKITQIGLNPKPFYFLVKFQQTMIWKITQIGLNPKPFKFFSTVSKDDDMKNDRN